MRATKARQLRNLAAALAVGGYGPELARIRPRRLAAAIRAGHLDPTRASIHHPQTGPAARLLYPGRDHHTQPHHG